MFTSAMSNNKQINIYKNYPLMEYVKKSTEESLRKKIEDIKNQPKKVELDINKYINDTNLFNTNDTNNNNNIYIYNSNGKYFNEHIPWNKLDDNPNKNNKVNTYLIISSIAAITSIGFYFYYRNK